MPPRRLLTPRIATRQVKHLIFRPAQGIPTVAKPELGTKRLCANCRREILRPEQGPDRLPEMRQIVLELAAVARGRDRAGARPRPLRPKEEVVAPETPEAEFVSLEEADAEAQGKKARRRRGRGRR